MKDIPHFEAFKVIKPIDKGISNNKKFFIETYEGKRMLLRMTDIKDFDRKNVEYKMMEQVYMLGVLSPKPYSFGICDGGKSVYSLAGWLEGEDVESVLPRMDEKKQYSTGIKAGELLRKIHTLPAPDDTEPWDIRFQNKIQMRIDLYNKHGLKTENGEKIVTYLHVNRDLLKNRHQTFWHGDFTAANQILTPDGDVGTIDFNYWIYGYGDPWWEFVIIPWGKEPTAYYLTGLIDGYFNNNPPCDFFEHFSYYYACDALSALCYTFLGSEPFKPEDGERHMENILRWFDNMNSPMPTWYKTKPFL